MGIRISTAASRLGAWVTARRRSPADEEQPADSKAGRAARRRMAKTKRARTGGTRRSRPAPSRRGLAATPGVRPRFGMVRDAVAELRRVTWPTPLQARNLTLMVVAVSAVMGFLLGGMDWLFSQFAAFIIGPA